MRNTSGITPLRIGAGITDALWYKPRLVTSYQSGNDFTSPYNVWAVPISFNRDMSITQFSLPYSQGAATTDGYPIDAVMIRFGLYEADENNLPKTLVKDWAWSAYTPGLSSPTGGYKEIHFPDDPATMLANKLYFWVVMIVGVTNNEEGHPDTVNGDELQGFFTFWTGSSGPLDPMASVGLTDEEVLYQPIGVSSYFLGDIVNAISLIPGAALAPFPSTLGALWDTTFTASNTPTFNVKGQPL